MANEEIMIRFGADTSGAQKGFNEIREHGKTSFVHASNGAREFKKLLHGVTEESPILGVALKAAMSPVAGLFLGAGIAVHKVTEFLKEMNKEFYEAGKAAETPFYKITSLIRAAHREAEKFNLEYFGFKHKPEKDKDLEFLEEKLSLIKAQAAEAAKLSPDKAAAIEKASTQVQFDLQGNALHKLAGKIGTSEGAQDQAASAYSAALNDTTIAKAKALIKVDEAQAEKMREAIKKLETQREGLGGMFGDQMIVGQINERILGIKEKLSGTEKRIDKNNDSIDRETERRKELAEKLAEAKGVHTEYKQQFDQLSKQLQATGQHLSILTGVANPEHTALPNSTMKALTTAQNNSDFGMAMQNYSADKRMQDWRKAHGMSWHDVTMPVNANQNQDKTAGDIATLNELFRGITTPEGMKVTFTVKDD